MVPCLLCAASMVVVPRFLLYGFESAFSFMLCAAAYVCVRVCVRARVSLFSLLSLVSLFSEQQPVFSRCAFSC